LEVNEIISSGLLELYASGLASAAEMEQVNKYIIQYPDVAKELVNIEIDLETFAFAYSVQPSASIKDKIFSRLDDSTPSTEIVASIENNKNVSAKLVSLPSYWKYLAVASIILLIGSILINFMLYNKNEEIVINYQLNQQALGFLKQNNDELKGDMEVVQNKYSKPIVLNGLEASPNAGAKIFWIANTGESYIDPSNLPDAPVGKHYQLWGIVDGKPVDAGMILTSKKGDKYRIQKMKTFGRVEAFAVTLESENGNTVPKGPMFVMGKI